MDGAVLTADGGPVDVGEHCVVMEHAVLRGTKRHPLLLGPRVLVGPGAHLSGCTVEEGAFLATGSAIFNGARICRRAEVRIHGVVHVNSVLAQDAVVPIGWVAVGDPAECFPPGEHDRIWPIQRSMDFRGTVWGASREVPRETLIERYARALVRWRGSEAPTDDG
jgi:carbonic anhydrase/acetyltransferase-like protein (isoleucine patch superfamily)